jgi:hypothetical protein
VLYVFERETNDPDRALWYTGICCLCALVGLIRSQVEESVTLLQIPVVPHARSVPLLLLSHNG